MVFDSLQQKAISADLASFRNHKRLYNYYINFTARVLMKITIVGLGYVGTVSAACLAAQGHQVCGVDTNRQKVDMLNSGKAPIIEPDLELTVQKARGAGGLRASHRIDEALVDADLCFINVATPSRRNGDIDSSFLFNACAQTASAVAASGKKQVVIIRSSILPSTFEQCCRLFETSAPGLIDVGVNPEFLREGSAIADFEHPPLVVIGTSVPYVAEMLTDLYANVRAPLYVLPPKEALLVKYASNAFHALKVTFANEMGALCVSSGANAELVMSTFCADTVLNISARYLKPGFAFGGSCLPKDVRALVSSARQYDLDLPVIRSILESNAAIVERAVTAVLDLGIKRIGIVGLSFKPNTDDLRESPFVKVAEALLGKGFSLTIYDPNVSIAKLTGRNKDFIESAIPHLSRLLVSSLEELTERSDLLIVGHQFVTLDQLGAITPRNCVMLDLSDLSVRKPSSQTETLCYDPIPLLAAS
jgi:GDP-mannose 6-dehydrogenase